MDELNPTHAPRRRHGIPRAIWLLPVAGAIAAAATGALTTTAQSKQVADQPNGLICDDGTLNQAGTERTFVLTARRGTIATPDGNTVPMWGYAPDNGDTYQYPSPFLCAKAGEQVKVVLHNSLGKINGAPLRTSIMFPGQTGVTADGVAAQAEYSTAGTSADTYTNNTPSPGAVRISGGTGVSVTGGTLTSGIELAAGDTLTVTHAASGAPTVALSDGTALTPNASVTTDTYTAADAVVKIAGTTASIAGGTASTAYDVAAGTDLVVGYPSASPVAVTGVDGTAWAPATIAQTFTGVDATVRLSNGGVPASGGTATTVYDVVTGTDLVLRHADADTVTVTSAVDGSPYAPASSTSDGAGTTTDTYPISADAVVKIAGTFITMTGGTASTAYDVAAGTDLVVGYPSASPVAVIGVDGTGWIPASVTDTYTGVNATVRLSGGAAPLSGGNATMVYDVTALADLVVTHATADTVTVTSAVDGSPFGPASSSVADTYTNAGLSAETITVTGGTGTSTTGGTAVSFYAVAPTNTISVAYTAGGAPTVSGVDGWPVATGGTPGTGLTSLVPSISDGESITYGFTATHAGSYLYVSGTETAKQQQMGLFGGLIIRTKASAADVGSLFDEADGAIGGIPADAAGTRAATVYGREFAQMLSDVDPEMHTEVNNGTPFDMANFTPRYWFVNGRSMPDTIAPNHAAWLPDQPYTGLVNVLPYDPVKSGLDFNPSTPALDYPFATDGVTRRTAADYDQYPAAIRYFNASETAHPFHPHAADTTLLGIDGRPLGPNTRNSYLLEVAPGQTMDATWRWIDTHAWDPTANPIPVPTHDFRDTRYTGGATWYGGSPYLGVQDDLPTGTVTYNECGEYYHVAHSHAVNEATTYGAAMGGMLTLYRIDPPGKEGCK